MDVLQAVWDAVYTGAGFFWKAFWAFWAFWALGLGYAISAGIQVFVSRREAAEHLGTPRPKAVGLAMGMGFATSALAGRRRRTEEPDHRSVPGRDRDQR